MNKAVKTISVFIAIAFLFLASLIVIFIIYVSKPAYERKEFTDFLNSKEELRLQLIDDIKSEKTSLDDNNYVIIDDKYDGVARKNRVFFEKCDEEECLISFLYESGFPDEDQYLFYSSEDEKLIEKNVDKSLYDYIKKVKEHWYFVQYN